MNPILAELLHGAGLSDIVPLQGGKIRTTQSSGFIRRLMYENSLKHDGQYKYPVWKLHKDSEMDEPQKFVYKELANKQQDGDKDTAYGASPFIQKHFGTNRAVEFVRGRKHKRGDPKQESEAQRQERKDYPYRTKRKASKQQPQQSVEQQEERPAVVEEDQPEVAEEPEDVAEDDQKYAEEHSVERTQSEYDRMFAKKSASKEKESLRKKKAYQLKKAKQAEEPEAPKAPKAPRAKKDGEPERPMGISNKDWKAYLKGSHYKEKLEQDAFVEGQRKQQKEWEDYTNSAEFKEKVEQNLRDIDESIRVKREETSAKQSKAEKNKGKYGDLHRMIVTFNDRSDFMKMTEEEKKEFSYEYKRFLADDKADEDSVPPLSRELDSVVNGFRFRLPKELKGEELTMADFKEMDKEREEEKRKREGEGAKLDKQMKEQEEKNKRYRIEEKKVERGEKPSDEFIHTALGAKWRAEEKDRLKEQIQAIKDKKAKK